MNEKMNQFLDSVCAHIQYKPLHQDIRDELTVHINEIKEDFKKETSDEEIALDMAISAMGDCSKIGKCLNEQHKPKTEWLLIGLTAVIAIIGGIVMYASSYFEFNQAVNFGRYLTHVMLGIAIMAGLYFFNYTKLKKLAWPLYIISFALLIGISLFGLEINGRRSLIISGSVISTEFTTLLFLISFAGFIDKERYKGSIAILKLFVLGSISLLPIIMQPKLSQALTLLIGYAVLMISAVFKNHFGGSRKRQFIILRIMACSCAFMLIGTIFSAPYRIDRLSHFMSAFITRGSYDPTGVGYQQFMADKWLKSSNLFGTASDKISGFPGITTDYALVNVFATLGWIIGAALILIIAVYIVRMFITTKKIKNDYGFYLSLAACTVLAVQFIMGILINLNLLPTASVYIPFISYGGVGYIVSMALVGLILSIWRWNNLIPTSYRNSIYGGTSFIKIEDRKLIIDLNQV